jgi:hypothetical protein
MNKLECLEYLNKVESDINSHDWEYQMEEYKLISHEELVSYMEYFNLPEAEMDMNMCIRLPEGWMKNVDEDSEDYNEVANKYENVYNLLLNEASKESEALDHLEKLDEKAAHREYNRMVFGK